MIKYTVTIPTTLAQRASVELLLDQLTWIAGGVTVREAQGVWLSPTKERITEDVKEYTLIMCGPDIRTGPSKRCFDGVLDNLVQHLLDMGEQAVLVQTWTHRGYNAVMHTRTTHYEFTSQSV